MIEIIPNCHPIFVHFSVSLFTMSVIFYVFASLPKNVKANPLRIVSEFEIFAKWCLWTSAMITIFTITAGFYAYYTVKHDAVSHAVMTTHRNWAISTASAIFLVALWSIWRYYKKKQLTGVFIVPLLIIQGLLLTTAWYGAELVFRYGVGVLSLPKGEEIKHSHSKNMESLSIDLHTQSTKKHEH